MKLFFMRDNLHHSTKVPNMASSVCNPCNILVEQHPSMSLIVMDSVKKAHADSALFVSGLQHICCDSVLSC